MTFLSRQGSLRRITLWAAAALGLWITGSVAAPRTVVELYSNGGVLRLDIAGSSMSTPLAIESLRGISIRAMDSVYPPGGRSIEVTSGRHTVLVDELPPTFDLPPGYLMPLGDWELDEFAGTGVVYERELEVQGAFEIRAVFTGRVHHHLTLELHGSPPVAVSFRRGLINNDMFIVDGSGDTVAATSIDPDPARDLLAAASIVLHAAAAAALLIALYFAADLVWSAAPGRANAITRSHRRLAWAVVLALAAVAGVISAWVAGGVLERLPHVPDSVVYLLQADWLLDGRLTGAVSSIQNHLPVPFTYVVDGRWVAHYPVGWPALLALGLAVGRPWLVAPLLAVGYTVLLYLIGRELYSSAVGILAVALAVVSPVSSLLFASTLSHAGSSTLVLLFLWLLLVARRTGSGWIATAAGIALGLAFGIRPLVAVAVAVPCGVVLAIDLLIAETATRPGRVLAGTIAGGLAGTVPTLLANQAISGSPFAFPYTLAKGAMYAADNLAFGIRNFDAILASTVPALYGWGWGFTRGWVFLALPLAFALVPFLLGRQTAPDVLLASCYLAVVIAHLGAQGHGLHGFGPRYHFDAFFALYLLTARGFQELARIGADAEQRQLGVGLRGAPALLAAALFLSLNGSAAAVLPQRLALYAGYNRVDRSLVAEVEDRAVDHALILFAERDWRDWAMASPLMVGDPPRDLTFAARLDDNSALEACCSDRPWFIWRDGTLAPDGAHPPS